jgi:hypothetical protein
MAALMLATALLQLGWLAFLLRRETAYIRRMRLHRGDGGSFDDTFSLTDMLYEMRYWIALSVLICAVVVALYLLMIWYRDWFGKDAPIYRLLMLPQPRNLLYLAKGVAVLLAVFGLCSWQLVLIVLDGVLYQTLVPADMRETIEWRSVLRANPVWTVVLPRRADQFAGSYAMGIVGVAAVFTAVLIERSVRGVRGLLGGIGYFAASALAVFVPLAFFSGYSPASPLYPEEWLAITFADAAAVLIVSLALGFRLLNKHIQV